MAYFGRHTESFNASRTIKIPTTETVENYTVSTRRREDLWQIYMDFDQTGSKRDWSTLRWESSHWRFFGQGEIDMLDLDLKWPGLKQMPIHWAALFVQPPWAGERGGGRCQGRKGWPKVSTGIVQIHSCRGACSRFSVVSLQQSCDWAWCRLRCFPWFCSLITCQWSDH